MKGEFIIFDNHFHLNYNNNFLNGAARFEKAGGNAINLTNLPDYSLPSGHYYETIYDRTLKMAEIVRRETELDVLVTLGPYPTDLIHFGEMNLDAEKIVKDGIDRASSLILENKANALGEVGRPHFPVPTETVGNSNQLLEYAFSACSDMKCPAILHTEDLDKVKIKELESMAKRSGLDPKMVVKHHALPENLLINSQIRFSIPATRRFVRDSVSTEAGFLLETDYVNDPNDDNRFLPPDSVPIRAKMIEQNYRDNWKEIFGKVFRDLPVEIFGKENFKALSR